MNPQVESMLEASHEGGAFHPELPGGRAGGKITVTPASLEFRSAKGGFDLPIDGIKLELGGASDRLIFLSHPNFPKVTVHTSDFQILKHPAFAHDPILAAQRKRIHTRRRVAWAFLLGVLGAFVLSLVGLFMARDSMVRTAAKAVPADWEIAAGDKLYEQITATKHVIEDAELNAQLEEITDPLLEGIKDNRYPFKFHIIEDSTLNAFAIPGGNVVLHSGLLLAADTPEEVAGVLGHEIAHVTQRHSIRSIISSAGMYLVLQAMLGDVTSIVAVLANNSAFLLDRKFSRDFEREADNHGWDYLLAANIDPEGMIEFFKKMEDEENRLRQKMKEATSIDVDPGALEVLSTHPATEERMKNLEAKWNQLEKKTGFRTFDLNYSAFKDSLRQKLHRTSDRNDQKDH